MTLRVLSEAEEEAREAAQWYENRRAGLGQDFLDALARAFEEIERNPQAFQQVTVQDPARQVRRYVPRRFPYSVFYEILASEVIVLAVAHSRRRPNYWQQRQG